MRSILKLSKKQQSLLKLIHPVQQRSFTETTRQKRSIEEIPHLKDFLKTQTNDFQQDEDGNEHKQSQLQEEIDESTLPSYLHIQREDNKNKTYFIETHGCQMNVADTEIVQSILESAGFEASENINKADVVLVNTCAIREGAEKKIWNKIDTHYHGVKKNNKDAIIGVLGCMAERLKEKFLENKNVDLVAGPDSYRDLPRLIKIIESKQNDEQAINVQLSFDETYADIIPVRKDKNKLHAWISIMRGCNNMCSFCIVPFTRGRERSRPVISIEDEVKLLRDQGIKEITLLGQNVNSYHDLTSQARMEQYQQGRHINSEGFNEMFKLRDGSGIRFAELMDRVSDIAPEVRFRFTSPHPKEFPDPLLEVIGSKANVCKQLHLPAQSGNTNMLMRMRRNYSREAYLDLIYHAREKIPGVALSSDFICGFCDETEQEFEDTLTLLDQVKFDMGFLFAYSMREKTHAHRAMKDNVPEDVKKERLIRMIDTFKRNQLIKQKEDIGLTHLMLIDGHSKKGDHQLSGLTDTNKRVVINNQAKYKIGDYVAVKITNATQNALIAEPIEIIGVQNFDVKYRSTLKKALI
ncbi:rna modification family [Stylonychia lemnae]|uniref:Rna modification family n=1 Tax=Stylonychia lemnae TaxID=5949 RepID=A0A078AYZ5_STYLE|nr:rna modification family [Stylonychia lemnae]|eukprot:CDW86023.1 rna modification family [Stylonychia lemnae]